MRLLGDESEEALLSRFPGGHLYPADNGCDGDHFHSDDPAVGISVDRKSPFPESDAIQRGCGFGMVTSDVRQEWPSI